MENFVAYHPYIIPTVPSYQTLWAKQEIITNSKILFQSNLIKIFGGSIVSVLEGVFN
jgi:hypothetical protein